MSSCRDFPLWWIIAQLCKTTKPLSPSLVTKFYHSNRNKPEHTYLYVYATGCKKTLPRPMSQDFLLCLALIVSQNVPWSKFCSYIQCVKDQTYNYFVYMEVSFLNPIWESLLLSIGPLVKNLQVVYVYIRFNFLLVVSITFSFMPLPHSVNSSTCVMSQVT